MVRKSNDTNSSLFKRTITLDVNDHVHKLEIENRWTLQKVLREKLGYTATKCGCGMGECGACTVLIQENGSIRPVLSCLTLAVDADGKKIVTLEGLAKDGKLHPIQKAFIDNYAIQCGFCTSGVIMSILALLNKNPHPNEDEIKNALAGNLCRCGTYPKVIKAALAASKEMTRSK